MIHCPKCVQLIPEPRYFAMPVTSKVRRVVRRALLACTITVVLSWTVPALLWGLDHYDWPLWYRIVSYVVVVGIPVMGGYAMAMDSRLRDFDGVTHHAAVFHGVDGHLVATFRSSQDATDYVAWRGEQGENLDMTATRALVVDALSTVA